MIEISENIENKSIEAFRGSYFFGSNLSFVGLASRLPDTNTNYCPNL